MREGLFDTVHAFGDRPLAGARLERDDIALAWRRLSEEGIRPPVHTNHGSDQDLQNIGGSIATYQQGDVPTSPHYHLDLTLAGGCRYFWTDADYDNDRWSFVPSDGPPPSLFVTDRGRDGLPFLRFRRYRGHLSAAPTATSLAEQLEPVLAKRLEGFLVIYQHLGCRRGGDRRPLANASPYLDDAALASLTRLRELERNGDLIVTTTSRLLDYAALLTARPWTIHVADDRIEVAFAPSLAIGPNVWPIEWSSLAGFTLALDTSKPVVATLAGEQRELKAERRNGHAYAWLPWQRIDMKAALEEARRIDAA
jgi:hypothetical protein